MSSSDITPHALIFDFDGLIMDTEWPIYAIWAELFEENGAELLLERWGVCVGNGENRFDPVAELQQLTGRSFDAKELETEHRKRFHQRFKPEPLPGVMELLHQAESLGWKIACASSSPISWVGKHLETLGILGRFQAICTADDVRLTKPDPELFLLAMQRLGVRGEHAIVVEDSPHGITAAKAAGALAVAVPNRVTRVLDLSHADARVSSLLEVDLLALMEERRRLGRSA
ncbi:MAG: HAD-IA family hydrolase [Candidatus Sumerlaeia bacterium]|nr:HAD-IA family hydrolase [Candidatus Sumerlaeia bacterium]